MEKISSLMTTFGVIAVGDCFSTVTVPALVYRKIKPVYGGHNAELIDGKVSLTKHFDDEQDVYKRPPPESAEKV